MDISKLDINKIKPNQANPRTIKDESFNKLVKSVKEFPEMLEIRPIVLNKDFIVLGGNMRYKACMEAGLKEIPVIVAENLTKEQQEEFVIKDNVSGGEWDWDMLANEWDSEKLESWGLDTPQFAPEVDYSILDGDDVSRQLDDMVGGVKKAIQIEFSAEHYDQAYSLVKFWRERKAYVGGMILGYLKEEKEKVK